MFVVCWFGLCGFVCLFWNIGFNFLVKCFRGRGFFVKRVLVFWFWWMMSGKIWICDYFIVIGWYLFLVFVVGWELCWCWGSLVWGWFFCLDCCMGIVCRFWFVMWCWCSWCIGYYWYKVGGLFVKLLVFSLGVWVICFWYGFWWGFCSLYWRDW